MAGELARAGEPGLTEAEVRILTDALRVDHVVSSGAFSDSVLDAAERSARHGAPTS